MGGLKGQGAFQVPEYFIMKVRKKYYYLSVVKLFFFFKLERKILWGSPSIAYRPTSNEDVHG